MNSSLSKITARSRSDEWHKQKTEHRRTRKESEAQTVEDIKAIYKFLADSAISET